MHIRAHNHSKCTRAQGCRECCFSTGGQYFAAVNGTTISIYNTYTCENVGNLRGHNGKVRSAGGQKGWAVWMACDESCRE